MLSVGLGGTGVWGRMDTCICMTESLRRSLGSITTLLISYKKSIFFIQIKVSFLMQKSRVRKNYAEKLIKYLPLI